MNEIEKTYHSMYHEVDHFLQKIEELQIDASSLEDKEKIVRMEMAFQAARDILENMITPGKKLTFIYEKGSVMLEIFDEKKA